MAEGDDPRVARPAMLFTAESLALLDEVMHAARVVLKERALALADADGRRLVTAADMEEVIDRGSHPDQGTRPDD
jgi:histone H3/H4